MLFSSPGEIFTKIIAIMGTNCPEISLPKQKITIFQKKVPKNLVESKIVFNFAPEIKTTYCLVV